MRRTSSPSVYTNAAGRKPSIPWIMIQPLILWWAATARVWPMNLVEGLPTGGVGNAGLGLPSVGSTVSHRGSRRRALRMVREADEEEVAIEAGSRTQRWWKIVRVCSRSAGPGPRTWAGERRAR